MIAYTFNNSSNTTITNGETFTSYTVDVGCTRSSAIEGNVTDKDVFVSFKDRIFRRIYSDSTTGQAFTEIIVRIAFEF